MAANGRKLEYAAWACSVDEVLQHHGVDASHGLTDAQVQAQRERYGYNELEKDPPKALWKLVLEQFDDMLVKVGRQYLPHSESLLAYASFKQSMRATMLLSLNCCSCRLPCSNAVPPPLSPCRA